MAHNERNFEERYETAPGSLERITFPPENDGEKSLLTLIEEHTSRTGDDRPTPPPDFSVSPADDLGEDEAYRLDHSLMRLGGNGF